MTPAEVKKTKLYRTLAPCIVKRDREELARMLAMVSDDAMWDGMTSPRLREAFWWQETEQGQDYWEALSDSLLYAGHDCY